MTADIRTLRASGDLRTGAVAAAWAVVERAFGTTPHPGDTDVELAVVDPARFYAAYDGPTPVATAGSFAFNLTVPGAVLPVAGVTWVGVLPTYRRQGLLGALMSRQLNDLHDAGTAVAALWASESAIYGRYGYGPASWVLGVTLPHGAAFTRPVEAGGLQLVDVEAGRLRSVYDRVAVRTPGFPGRDQPWWDYRLHDPVHRRNGASPLQCVVTDGGYALYSVTGSWDDGLPVGVVHVRELLAVDDGSRARLWRHLLDLDLTRTVEARMVPVDDPLLLHLLAEPREARPKLRDNLFVRLVDVGTALTGRHYACEVDVVLELDDAQCPWNSGRWRLVGGRSGAECRPTKAPADLVVTPADLGAAYLGGTPLRGRGVQERTPGALALASTALGPVDLAPWCPQVF